MFGGSGPLAASPLCLLPGGPFLRLLSNPLRVARFLPFQSKPMALDAGPPIHATLTDVPALARDPVKYRFSPSWSTVFRLIFFIDNLPA